MIADNGNPDGAAPGTMDIGPHHSIEMLAAYNSLQSLGAGRSPDDGLLIES